MLCLDGRGACGLDGNASHENGPRVDGHESGWNGRGFLHGTDCGCGENGRGHRGNDHVHDEHDRRRTSQLDLQAGQDY